MRKSQQRRRRGKEEQEAASESESDSDSEGEGSESEGAAEALAGLQLKSTKKVGAWCPLVARLHFAPCCITNLAHRAPPAASRLWAGCGAPRKGPGATLAGPCVQAALNSNTPSAAPRPQAPGKKAAPAKAAPSKNKAAPTRTARSKGAGAGQQVRFLALGQEVLA